MPGPLARLDSEGRLLQVYIYGTRLSVPDAIWHYTYDPVTGEASRSTLAVMTDMRGSVRMVMDVSTGNVVHQLTYDPWGVVLTDSSPGYQPFAFAGGVHDPRTGMLRFGRRDYDPGTGRWTNRDPALFGGGQSNLYTYCAGDPVGLVDPWGTIVETGWDAFNIGLGIGSLAANIATGDYAAAAFDGAGLIIDVAAVVLPGVPGGAGAALRGIRQAEVALGVAETVHYMTEGAGDAQDCSSMGASTAGGLPPLPPGGGVYLIRNRDDPDEILKTGRTNNFEVRRRAHQRNPHLAGQDFEVVWETDVHEERRGLEQVLYERSPGTRDRIPAVSRRNRGRYDHLMAIASAYLTRYGLD